MIWIWSSCITTACCCGMQNSQMQKNKQKDADIIHKLDSIGSHAGGLFCERMLVSASPLDYENKKGRKIKVTSRAKSYDIDVLQYNDIKQFAILSIIG